MIKHIVLFALKGFPTPEEKARHLLFLKAELEALTNEIDCLLGLRVRINENPAESYDFMLEAETDSLKSLKSYAEHPQHKRIVDDFIKPHLDKRACIDYGV